MYDYVIVGSGLFGCVFAHEMHQAGRQCLVLERRDQALSIVKRRTASISIAMVPTFSIRRTAGSGTMSISSSNSIILSMRPLPIIKANYTICLSI